MSTLTTNLSLVKPDLTDNADVEVINANMDLLDAAVASKETPTGAQTKADVVQANLTAHAGAADPHTVYVKHSLATAVSDFLVSSGAGVFVKKTLADVKTILGLGTAAYTASTAYATAAQGTLATNALPSSQKAAAGGLASLGSDSKLTASQLPSVSVTGFFTDTTTSMVAGSTYTKTIPLGLTGKVGSLMLVTTTYGSISIIHFDTVQARSRGIGNTPSNGNFYYKSDGNLGCAGTSVSLSVILQNAYISGTDLILVFKNNQPETRPLNVDCFWEVQA